MKALVNARLYTPNRLVSDGVLLHEGGRIVELGAASQVDIPAGGEALDLRGAIVCSGYVDIHVHGGGGADNSDGTPESVATVARRHLRAGTTSLLATTSTAPLPDIWRAFEAIVAAMDQQSHQPGRDQARILGIHMEGPFLSVAQRGAHAPELLRMPSPAERERLLSYLPHLKRLCLAPEREGALDLIGTLADRGVLVSGAHSDALYAQVCRAMERGLRHITHLWSGMSTVRRIGPKRHSGMLQAALVERGLTGEVIADGYHLPSSLLKIAYRLKGPDKLCLISDAMAGSGAPPGSYQIAGQEALVEPGAGVAITPDRKAFAGSISTVAQCVQQMVQVVGISLQDALRMATETPASILGLEREIGRLAPGAHADFLVLDPITLLPQRVFLEGREVQTADH